MDDALFGTRNKRGDWKPNKLNEYPPVFVWPARPVEFVKWLFGYHGYILPWNLFFAVLSILLWLYATPSVETLQHFAPGWIAFLLARNALIVFLFYGAFHLRLYMQKAQGTQFKFNGKWPSTDSSAFLFRNQNIDNVIWTFASGVPIWTALEILTLWAFANHYIPYVSFAEHPYYCVALFLSSHCGETFTSMRCIASSTRIGSTTRCTSCIILTSIRVLGPASPCIRLSTCSTSRSA
jgi:hypothetical protein